MSRFPLRRRGFATCRAALIVSVVLALFAVTSACSSSSSKGAAPLGGSSAPGTSGAPPDGNVYAHDMAGMLAAATRDVPYRIYVPNHGDGTVTVIDGNTRKVLFTYPTGPGSQHVVPAWDLSTLYSANDEGGNSLTPIDPKTGRRKGPNIPVQDPYNMYFTPDGQYAIVVAEEQHRLNFADPHTFQVKDSVPVSCDGVNHIDFSADGSYLIATCEFGDGGLVKVDVHTHKVLGYLHIGGAPQDIKIEPAGKIWYVSDMNKGGVHLIDGDAFREVGFIPTGPEAHGLYPSRDAKVLYVSNRGGAKDQGSVSVIDFATRKVIANWPITPPSTPDMGGVSDDGRTLWLSGRRTNDVYAIDTATGHVTKIKVGKEPHGLCVWPQPGRYSLGHTGILR